MTNSFAREARDWNDVDFSELDNLEGCASFLGRLTTTPEVLTEDRVREIVAEELSNYKEDRLRSDPLFKKIMRELKK